MSIKKYSIIILVFLLTLTILGLGWFYYQNLRGIGPVINKPPTDITESLGKATSTSSSTVSDFTEQNKPLVLPVGFRVEVFAKDLSGARALAVDQAGHVWLSQTSAGTVAVLENANGKLVRKNIVLTGLNKPHGIAFDPKEPDMVYIAEETRIVRARIFISGDLELETVVDLPKGGRHTSRSLVFDKEGQLYVSIGSTCDVCQEKDEQIATIMKVNVALKKLEPLAKGLRNSVFMTLNYQSGDIWATEMGRDLLGDDLPPDEINIINTKTTSTYNYGWPICYGKNIHDTQFDKNTYFRNPCEEPFETPSFIDLPAHSAPLGLTFVPNNSKWPSEYKNNLFVAFHGSWNRSTPTGYKVVRIILDEKNNFVRQEDFISGWLTGKGALGRPVDLVFGLDGALYISDDKAGVIYRIEYQM
ncbi:MAG: PQQ-dependent sugar dehydrogenase [Candidatus Magasanikiibacteriota bacterium]